jgi:enoyl-CoA hydratase/carnithine racemase
MTDSDVLVTRQGGFVHLTLNRPAAANALSWSVVRGLRSALASLDGDDSVRGLVLSGSGAKAFCAGADLKERRGMSLDETRLFLHELNATLDLLSSLPFATIAALQGAAFGGGLEIALACDFRLAAETAEMGLTEVRLGIIPGAGGTQRLARVVGLPRAKELILTGKRCDAKTALAWGLVHAIAPAAELPALVARFCQELEAAAPRAVAEAKRVLDAGYDHSLGEGLAFENAAYEAVLTSEDRNEGLAAFAEKRPPVWKGR